MSCCQATTPAMHNSHVHYSKPGKSTVLSHSQYHHDIQLFFSRPLQVCLTCPHQACTGSCQVVSWCVIAVHRYTRGVCLRFPFRLMTDGRPYDFINMAFKAELLLAGYAVVSMDFRGTGKALYMLCLVGAERKPNLHCYSVLTMQTYEVACHTLIH